VSEREPPARVRVSGPPRRRTPAARTSDIDAETRLGGMYMGSLLREQLRLALGILAVLLGTVGLLPLLFHMVPRLGTVHLLGLPLAWLLLGVLVYPLLFLLGWLYVRRAERNERHFADLMGEVDS
jgi:nucleoside permease NupC